MTFDAYSVYCEWCVATKRKPPTREWWNNACRKAAAERAKVAFRQSLDSLEISREAREGWGYANLTR